MRAPLDLSTIRAARSLRAGKTPDVVRRELGLSVAKITNVQSIYSTVPDGLLARIERVLTDRERLKRLISDLLRA